MINTNAKVSRRAAILGLGGLGLAAASYGGVSQAYAYTHTSASTKSSAGQLSQGTTFITYKPASPKAAWAPASDSIATASGKSLIIFNAKTGKTSRQITTPYYIQDLSWSPDGRYIAISPSDNNNTVFVYEAKTGQVKATYTGHTASLGHIAWSPDGKRIASTSFDQTVQVWEALSGKKLVTYASHNTPTSHVAWSPDSKYIVSGIDGKKNGIVGPTVQVWESANGNTIRIYLGAIDDLDWSPDGKNILSADSSGNITIRNAFTTHYVKTYAYDVQINAVAYAPDGKHIAFSGGNTQAVSDDGFTRVIRLRDDKTFTYTAQKLFVGSVRWSPDSQRVVTASADQTAKVWQAV